MTHERQGRIVLWHSKKLVRKRCSACCARTCAWASRCGTIHLTSAIAVSRDLFRSSGWTTELVVGDLQQAGKHHRASVRAHPTSGSTGRLLFLGHRGILNEWTDVSSNFRAPRISAEFERESARFSCKDQSSYDDTGFHLDHLGTPTVADSQDKGFKHRATSKRSTQTQGPKSLRMPRCP